MPASLLLPLRSNERSATLSWNLCARLAVESGERNAGKGEERETYGRRARARKWKRKVGLDGCVYRRGINIVTGIDGIVTRNEDCL